MDTNSPTPTTDGRKARLEAAYAKFQVRLRGARERRLTALKSVFGRLDAAKTEKVKAELNQ
jgi:hypothetical protein